jgi:hypothetical protein
MSRTLVLVIRHLGRDVSGESPHSFMGALPRIGNSAPFDSPRPPEARESTSIQIRGHTVTEHTAIEHLAPIGRLFPFSHLLSDPVFTRNRPSPL